MYPVLMGSGNQTTLIVFLIALGFCLCNGFLQTRFLLMFASYPTGWVTSVTFLSGKIIVL